MSGGIDTRLVQRGAITGAGAFVGGAILVFAFALLIGGTAGAIASIAPISTATMGYAALHAWLAVLDGSPLLLALAAIPAVILVAAGYSAAQQTTDLGIDPLTRGAAVTVGYCSVMVLSLLYSLVRAGSIGSAFGGSGGAELFPIALAVLFTGIAFPLVFGAAGGWVAKARGY